MEEKDNLVSGVAVSGEEAPDTYRIAPRNENPSPSGGPTMAAAATASPMSLALTSTEVKKKRGRPRKYGPDKTVSSALSPMPISSSIPLTGEFSAWKRGRGRPVDSVKKSHKYDVFESSGEKIAYSVGANFTPHVLTVHAGEDVTMKIMSFSQQGSRAICILSANGTISNVTLRQPSSSGGTLTYEGRFEILSLSGSYIAIENAGTKSRSGGMSVALAGPDGRVVGGGLAGMLIAAGPVQVVVGSFLPGHQQEQKPKKQRLEPVSSSIVPIVVNAVSGEEMKVCGGVKPILTSPSFHGNNSTSVNPMHSFKNSAPESKSLSEEESKGLGQPNCEVSY
ncbi:PREDICTED: AT-hook motif nuclear-localized [Prunus dulcis]|uniref:AT-hook motif nuclear-localized protein n=1 Tax=Prunus dulcis TaxID=3755 RepID=A0A5E4E841_PRUDU|nr:AT-hook motif nuclear-localized protein 3-like [Prunus dulcis]XP_034206128.1 AT-hook motif nuclear-localized protein 3 [Prunus dulcis]VVA10980.1 PREDICTED: AT-hook motif nuclear-localized [Prunus dulcis]VVA41053.1 PREDICTED: AT-hook motif nuclear-localized [Prunus dulcis]